MSLVEAHFPYVHMAKRELLVINPTLLKSGFSDRNWVATI